MRRALLCVIILFPLLWVVGCSSTGFSPAPTSQAQIAFVRQIQPLTTPQPMAPPPDSQIYIMNVDGTGQTQVGPDGLYHAVDVSHDGTMLVYTAYNGGEKVYVAKADGSGNPVLVSDAELCLEPGMPEFTPDGSRVYFLCGYTELWSNNITGTDPQHIHIVDAWVHAFTLAPDGTILAQADTFASGYGLAIVNPDGTVDLLFEGSYDDHNPSVNAAGTQMVFWRNVESNQRLYIVDVGGEPKLLPTTYNAYDPIFVGDKILFVSDPNGGDEEIFSIDPSGANETQLTSNNVNDWFGYFETY